MVSDVLHDAIREIEEYQEELPELYEPVEAEIAEVKEAMWGLIMRLNTAPKR